jgi:PBSX family phage terminase large subunit
MGKTGEVRLEYQPQTRQKLFHTCPADEILYGGAAGGGKSEAMLMDALKNAMKHKDVRIIMFRRTFADLERSLILRSKQVFPREVAEYNESKKRWKFKNGSMIEFAHMKMESDVFNYQGAEYDFIYWDELTHFTYTQYTYMLSRLRGVNPEIRRQVKSATNPGGVGHAWVKERFIDLGASETIHRPVPSSEEPKPGTRCFIPAKIHDNRVLLENDPSYLRRLENLPEGIRKQLLDGNWDSFDGMAFSEWDKEVHVIKPFKIPEHWKRFRSVDYGRSAPFCCLWFAIDGDYNIYIYKEAYQAGLNAVDQADLINEMTDFSEKIEYTVLDSACWIANQHGESIADTYSSRGVYCEQASKNRLNGKDRVHAWLKVYETDEGKRLSKLKVFESCKHLVRTLPSLPIDMRNPEDVDTDAEDHAYDALRYGVMSRPDPRTYDPVDSSDFARQEEQKICFELDDSDRADRDTWYEM